MEQEKSLFKRIVDRILPPKAEVGFLQEKDKDGVIHNSSTRLLQLFFAFLLVFTTNLTLTSVFNDDSFDINKFAAVGTIYFLNVVAVIAPKYLKNSENVNTFLAVLNKKNEDK